MLIINVRSTERIKLPLGHGSTIIPLPAEVVQLSITLRKFRKQAVSNFYPLASCVIQQK